jgi:hypothetical protein
MNADERKYFIATGNLRTRKKFHKDVVDSYAEYQWRTEQFAFICGRLSPLGLDVNRAAEHRQCRFLHRLGERRVRVHGDADILR